MAVISRKGFQEAAYKIDQATMAKAKTEGVWESDDVLWLVKAGKIKEAV